MTYNELQLFVKEAIDMTNGDKEELLQHEAEILTALTGVFSDELVANQKEQEQLIELWSNQQGNKSQLLLGKKHIRIHDGMLEFIKAFLVGGAFELVLEISKGLCFPSAFPVSTVSSIVLALVQLFRSAATLDDYDFCLYMQVVTHYYEKKRFTKDDVISWYPISGVCNMHTDKWNCKHAGANDICGVTLDDIDWILNSLVEKKILDRKQNENILLYKIKG